MKKFLLVLAVGLGLCAAAFWFGRPAYRHWKGERALARARQALALPQPDFRKALLSARQALEVNPNDVQACRMFADVLETSRSQAALQAALQWRQRVVDLAPGYLTNHLDLARTAMLQGNYARAAQALQLVDQTQQNSAAFHQMAAMVAVGLNNIEAAERHFSEAARLDPQNKLLQLNSAVIHLQAKDQQVVAGALKSLEQLYADPACHKDALRHLALAALHNKDFARAAVFTKELQADAQAPLEDRFMHLGALKNSASPDYSSYLTELETFCAKDAEHVNALTGWLLAHELTDEAARWLATLPAEMQEKQPVPLARADCFMARSEWPGLQALLQNASWSELDFLRQAMLARALREQKQDLAAQTEWRGAVRQATEHAKQLALLARMANKWNWDREKEELLWLIVQRHPAERWALQSLNQFYTATGNTHGLYKVYTTLVGFEPQDVAAKNNLAAVSLLLNLQTTRAHELAREAYLRATNNAAFASTYAFSLYVQGRPEEARVVLESLKPSQLENPVVALYYGALQATNAPEKAKKYLDLAETAVLLPEEKTLLAAARKRL